MTGLEIFLVVVVVGGSVALGLMTRWRNQLQFRTTELESVLEQQRPIVQAAPEVDRQLRYYADIARTVPEKDALLHRYSGIRDVEAHLALLQDQQRQWELHLRVLEQQHQAKAESQQAELQEKQRKSEQQLRELRKQKQEATSALDALEGRIAAHDVGLAGPRYDFREADEYKLQLDQIRSKQEVMVKIGSAAVCLMRTRLLWTAHSPGICDVYRARHVQRSQEDHPGFGHPGRLPARSALERLAQA